MAVKISVSWALNANITQAEAELDRAKAMYLRLAGDQDPGAIYWMAQRDLLDGKIQGLRVAQHVAQEIEAVQS
jgi:hypothetical protein